jgi:hypothetical protein
MSDQHSQQEREIETFPVRVCECGAIHDRPEKGCPECGSVIAREVFEAVPLAALQDREAEEKRARKAAWDRHQAELQDYVEANCSQKHRIRELDQMVQVSEEHTRHWEQRANRAEAALGEARKRLTSVIAEEHEIQAELERRDQAWMATRLSYCTGGLVILRAALDTSIEDREPEELCPRCHGQRRVPSQLHQGTEPCPDCKPPDDPEDSTGMPVVTGTKPPAPCSDRAEQKPLRESAARKDERLARERAEPSSSDQEGEARKVIVDFLDSWRFCPVSTASAPARSCFEDAATQLLAALACCSTQPVPVPSGASGDWPEEATSHELKCWPPYFEDIRSGRKNFEVRVADRDFKPGDILLLREYDPDARGSGERYTGRGVVRRATYVLHGNQFGIKPGHVVIALAVPAESEEQR